MTREDFEQLASRWLDDPADAALAARIEDAVARQPGLAELRAEWIRLNDLLRAAQLEIGAVDFDRFRERVAAALDARAEDAVLDRLLIESVPRETVKWDRFAARVGAAIDAADVRQPRAPRIIKLALATGGLAAAAAIALFFAGPWFAKTASTRSSIAMVSVTRDEPPADAEVALVEVHPAGGNDAARDERVSFSVARETEARAPQVAAAKPASELYLSISDARMTTEVGGGGIY